MSQLAPIRRLPRNLAVLLLIYSLLATIYGLAVPIFEGPDEDAHVRYMTYIGTRAGLPIQEMRPAGGAAGHEGWQPPLYYALVGVLTSWIDTSDLDTLLVYNPLRTMQGDPTCCGRNLILHTPVEDFPYTRTVLAVHLARLASVLFGALTVVAVFFAARRVLGDDGLAIAVAAFTALNPTFLYINSLVTNDSLVIALSSVVLFLLVRLGDTTPTLHDGILLGIAGGLAVLTKSSALALLPLGLVALVFIARHKRSLRSALIVAVPCLPVAGLVSGWWFLRNLVLYGDASAANVFRATNAALLRSSPLTVNELFVISFDWLRRTYWGGPVPGSVHPLLQFALDGLGVVVIAALILFVLRRRYEAWSWARRYGLVIIFLWLIIVCSSVIFWMQVAVGADNARLLFPATLSLSLLAILGLAQIVPRRVIHWIPQTMLLLAIGVLVVYVIPTYARPSMLSGAAVRAIPHALDVHFGESIELLGYELEGLKRENAGAAQVVRPNEEIVLSLFWRAASPVPGNYRVFVHLVGRDDRLAGQRDMIPYSGRYSTLIWQPGDIFRDDVRVRVNSDADSGLYYVHVGLYDVTTGKRLAVPGGETSVSIVTLKLGPLRAGILPGLTRPAATASNGDTAILAGSAVEPTGTAVSRAWRVVLTWQAQGELKEDYNVFVHVLDGNNQIVAQDDAPPAGGWNPTSTWLPGELVRDEHHLSLPPSVQPGTYTIRAGLYRLTDGIRLPIATSDGLVSDSAVAGTIIIP